MSEPYREPLSDDERRQLAEVLDTLRKAVNTVDGFNREPADYAKFDAVAVLPVTLAEAGASLAEVVTGLADAKQARLVKLKADAVKARAAAATPTWAEQANGAPMPDAGGHDSLDAPRHGE